MNIKYQAPKGSRFNNRFWFLEPKDRFILLYNKSTKQWWNRSELNYNEKNNYNIISELIKISKDSIPIHSLKAAIRHIEKHNEIPKGTQFVLINRYVGKNIIITK